MREDSRKLTHYCSRCETKYKNRIKFQLQVSPDIESWVTTYQGHIGQPMASQQKEYLQMFYLVLQVTIGKESKQ